MIYVVLPIYNEGKSLGNLISKINVALSSVSLQHTIVAVNDGSTDNSGEILRDLQKEYPLIIISHQINRGLGETIRDGFELAAENAQDDDIIVRLDADGTQDPSLIPRMCSKLDEGFDVIIASRYAKDGEEIGLSFKRKFFSRMANLLMKICFPVKGLLDYSCGYRAYKASIIKQAIRKFGNNFIELKGLGFTVTPEKLVKLIKLRARIAEVPLVLRYDLKESKSKMESYATIMGYIVLIIKNIGKKKISKDTFYALLF